MSNPIETIGHGLKVAAEHTGKVIAYPFTHTAHFVAVLGTALKEEPTVRSAVEGLVKAAEVVIADGGADIAEKGLNLVDDLKTVADVQAFFKYFTGTFLPVVETAYKDLQADVK